MSTYINTNWQVRVAAAPLAVLGALLSAGSSLGLAEHYAHGRTDVGTSGYHSAGTARRAVCPVAVATQAPGIPAVVRVST